MDERDTCSTLRAVHSSRDRTILAEEISFASRKKYAQPEPIQPNLRYDRDMSGTLIAIGGAARMDGAALEAFYQYSGGADACITILPTASLREESGHEFTAAMETLGLKRPAQLLPVRQRCDCENSAFLQAVRQSSGVFLTGGNPLRLTTILGGTPLHQELLALYQRGAVVAGSSAGSAALSALMISQGSSGSHPRNRMANFVPGLGLISKLIFDQHFRQRNRMGRLIYAVASNPGLLGVGIDEDTAAIVQDNLLSVRGSSAVTIVDGTSITQSNLADLNGSQMAAVSGVRLHILTHGCTFDLDKRTAQIPTKEE
jgi:cyanophycinase